MQSLPVLLDQVGLWHGTFTEAALNLIIRSSEGTLWAVGNLSIGAMIEAGFVAMG